MDHEDPHHPFYSLHALGDCNYYSRIDDGHIGSKTSGDPCQLLHSQSFYIDCHRLPDTIHVHPLL